MKAIKGPVNATIMFSSSISPYFEGGICDFGGKTCAIDVSFEKDEERYIYLSANLSNEIFIEDLLNDGIVTGDVRLLSNGQYGPEQYNITFKKSMLFDKSKEIAESYEGELITHKSVYYFMSMGIILVTIMLLFTMIRFIGVL